MFRVIRTFGLALGIIGAIIAAQAPEFAQQYAQRLGGAIEELRRQIATLDSDAQATGNTRESAIENLRKNADALVARRGEAVRGDVERFRALDAQKQAIDAAASPLGKTVAVARNPDVAVAWAAYRDYRPAVPTTTDGLIAGLVGFLVAWGGWRVVTDFGRSLSRRRKRPTPATRAI
ncbi:DUF2937 family protein [Methylobacterium haplocladii]|uniref:DUF2937 domain-containing protein n=1 Tax=Methylobacterium haplocladii TaxID=1176176 RepID=A0A512IR99_9HYPH|nr:DUF2937 family protein [Methylobacterium haplocladii]GEP00245.1 hypothetical protein MHA02_26320 [Methylobacterium haplocladii]GJD84247.1 hypothetical protein HPGCJGGD_2122 [Methylobacterium haplocladii]GLS60862.1 hypothetical protein GCM10007887_35510 [Methylobacterium haplocladii]